MKTGNKINLGKGNQILNFMFNDINILAYEIKCLILTTRQHLILTRIYNPIDKLIQKSTKMHLWNQYFRDIMFILLTYLFFIFFNIFIFIKYPIHIYLDVLRLYNYYLIWLIYWCLFSCFFAWCVVCFCWLWILIFWGNWNWSWNWNFIHWFVC